MIAFGNRQGCIQYLAYVPSLKLYEKILEDRFDKIKTCLGPREFHQKESSILDY